MRIRMLIAISGGRHDDRPWPPAGAEIDVPDHEGQDLLRAGHAVYVAPSAPVPPPVETARVVSEGAATAAGPVPRETVPPGPSQAELDDAKAGQAAQDAGPVPDEMPPPAPGDPKQAWVDYAVSQGAGPETAGRMSKADLMSRYGGRL